jgi:hypothetical protein
MPKPKKLPPGMILRGRVYYAKFRAGGRVFHKRLSSNQEDAIGMLHDMRARAYRQDFGITDNDMTIADLRARYEREIAQVRRPGTVTRYKLGLRNVLERMRQPRSPTYRPTPFSPIDRLDWLPGTPRGRSTTTSGTSRRCSIGASAEN